MRLGNKIILAQAPIGVILVLIMLIFIIAINTIGNRAQKILANNFASIIAVQKMKESLEGIHSLILSKSGLPSIKKFEIQLDGQLNRKARNIAEPGEAETLRELQGQWRQYKKEVQELLNSSKNKDSKNISISLEKEFKRLKNLMNRIINLNQDVMIEKNKSVASFVTKTAVFILTLSSITFLLGVLGSWSLTRKLLRPLNELKDLVRRIGKNPDESQMHVAGADEVSELADEFNLMTYRLKQYHQSSLGQLIETKQVLQTVFDSFPDPIFVIKKGAEILSFNHAASEIFNLIDSRKGLLLDVSNDSHRKIIEIVDQVCNTRLPFHAKHMNQSVIINRNNNKVFLLPWAQPIYNRSNEVVAVSLILQNITESPLFKITDNEMFATLVHAFKPPLNAIQMAIHACLEEIAGPLGEAQKELLSNAREDCQALQKMTSDFLEVYRLDDISQPSDIRPVEISALIKMSLLPLHQFAQEQNISIKVDISPIIGKVKADPQKLQSVLTNIIDNAIRYGKPASTVALTVFEKGEFTLWEVHNEGVFIPKKHQKHIFEKFYSGDGKNDKGLGLGLYIAHKIITNLGGKIGVKSSKASGTAFWFTIPVYTRSNSNSGSGD